MKPIFIFSLPRAGSTLLQRVLSADHQIATVAEPWFLLPMVYPLKKIGVEAEYSHYLTNIALEDFISGLSGGGETYNAAIRAAAMSLYEKSADDKAEYFIDKTPRYSLISDHIVDIFPEGKFIMLWRNPLSVIASLIETFGKGKWVMSHFKSDLYPGILNLIKTYKKNHTKCLAIKYEDLVSEPEKNIETIANYLGIPLDSNCLKSFSDVEFRGRLGDPSGIKIYDSLDKTPVEKWKNVVNTPLRKWWCKRYLRWLGTDNLAVMGYDLESLLSDLKKCETSNKYLFNDLMMMIYGEISVLLEFRRIAKNFKKILRGLPLVALS